MPYLDCYINLNYHLLAKWVSFAKASEDDATITEKGCGYQILTTQA